MAAPNTYTTDDEDMELVNLTFYLRAHPGLDRERRERWAEIVAGILARKQVIQTPASRVKPQAGWYSAAWLNEDGDK